MRFCDCGFFTRFKYNKSKWLLRLFIVVLGTCVVLSLYSDFKSDEFVVCVDAGHGGESIGAVYGNDERLEKDDNLRFSLLLKDELEKHDVKVVLTRDTDESVSLKKRCLSANFNKADFFISVHRNSVDNPEAKGTEIWLDNDATEMETSVAQNILDNLEEVGISENRGIKKGFRSGRGEYYINANTNKPSCLLEIGFISNADDNTEFDENIKEYAKAVADAIVDIYE